jgi:hypothetical protein
MEVELKEFSIPLDRVASSDLACNFVPATGFQFPVQLRFVRIDLHPQQPSQRRYQVTLVGAECVIRIRNGAGTYTSRAAIGSITSCIEPHLCKKLTVESRHTPNLDLVAFFIIMPTSTKSALGIVVI